MKILVIRNDKLGDFMLSLPVFALLKHSLDDCQTTALVPEYTADIARICPWIDDVIIDPQKFSLPLIKLVRERHFDAVITLYSTTRIGITCLASGIKERYAPATKIAQIFYNHRISQRRSRSEKPEYRYNLDLAESFLSDLGVQVKPVQAPFIDLNQNEIDALRTSFCQKNKVDPGHKLVFVHSGSGGSANNLSLEQYALLIKKLDSDNLYFVLTAGPGELGAAQTVSAELSDIPHTVFHSTKGLINFAKHIAFADLFISGSTGPLHIAGALNVPTAAFYPLRQSATPLRWQTLNTEDRRIAFSPPETGDKEDMSRIDLDGVAEEIRKKYFS